MIGKKKCNETKPLARKWNNCGAGLASMIWRAVGEDAEVGPHQSVTGVPLAPQARFIPSPQPSDIFLPILHLHLHPRPERLHPILLVSYLAESHKRPALHPTIVSLLSLFHYIQHCSLDLAAKTTPGSCPVISVPAPSRVVR